MVKNYLNCLAHLVNSNYYLINERNPVYAYAWIYSMYKCIFYTF